MNNFDQRRALAHDVLNYLSTLRLALSTIQRHPERSAEYLVYVDQQLTVLQEYLQKSLGHCEENTTTDNDERTTDLDNVISRVVATFAPYIEQKNLQLIWQARSGSLTIAISEVLLECVLMNLVSNAIKYTEPQGRIRLSVSEEQDRIQITVQDNGIGIPEQEIPHIFQTHYRSHMARAVAPGEGIGLAIVKGILEAVNGSITVASQPGNGTTFTLSFPKETIP